MRTEPPLGALQEADLCELDWLVAQDSDGFLGYAPLGWPAETWVLHTMWEDPTAADPRTVEERWREEYPGERGIGVLAYESAPFNVFPPPEWRRLRWRELADRLGEPLTGGIVDDYPIPPCFRWFSIRSWPESIWNPSEGTIDATAGERLIELLADHSADGFETTCFCFYDILTSPDLMERLVLTGPLHAVFDAARHSETGNPTPANIWPADRSWLLWTNYDLWGTRLIGSPEIVAGVEADPELETVDFSYHPLPHRINGL